MGDFGRKRGGGCFKASQILKERGEVVYQALGRLVREGKTDFHRKEGKTFAAQSRGIQDIQEISLNLW